MAQILRIGMLATLVTVAAPMAAAPADPLDADVLYLPTPYPVVDAMLRLASVGPGDRVYDLGAGDGRIAIAAARDFGAQAVGIELDARKASEARASVRRAGLTERVEIREGDVLRADLSGATVVTVFLFPGINAQLAPKLRRELAPGTRVVSHRFGLGDWPPDRQASAGGHPLFLWVVPRR